MPSRKLEQVVCPIGSQRLRPASDLAAIGLGNAGKAEWLEDDGAQSEGAGREELRRGGSANGDG